MKSGMQSPILPIHGKIATERGMMTQRCARGHGDSETEGLSLPTLVLRSAISTLAGPGHLKWFGGRLLLREDATLQATSMYKHNAKHFQCFHSQANHRGVQIFLLHFGGQWWILLCFGNNCGCACQIVGVICYTCIISILLCCYYNCKESRNACYISTKLQQRTYGLDILSPESPC
jgi:hypothetical protein